MIALVQEIEGLGCPIEIEDNNIKLLEPRILSENHKGLLRKNKNAVIELYSQQDRARKQGWLVYNYGESYEKRVGNKSFVYIFLEPNGRYTVWRGTWKESNHPDSERVLVSNVDFETAFDRANDYIDWFGKRGKKPFKKS